MAPWSRIEYAISDNRHSSVASTSSPNTATWPLLGEREANPIVRTQYNDMIASTCEYTEYTFVRASTA